ncbi:MAG TPA: M23 family metallopeptidase [Gemmatimonadaceae bacterium]|nr:M23 family metallopeptidase [Gemmatimonadaceae bacterium]
MTASAHRSRCLVLAALFGAALSASCIEVRDASDDKKAAEKATADSAAGALAATTPAPARTGPYTAQFGPDSSTRIRGGPMYTPEATAALQTDTLHAVTEIDTSSTGAAATRGDAALLKGALIVPVQGISASALYDTYDDQRGGGARAHEALDIPAPRGTPVLSATGGRVLKLFNSEAGGKMVYAADSSERFILMYAHLDSYANGLAEGQPLRQGQVIGAVGTTGNAPPNLPHLHFALARSANVKEWWKGTPVDPFPLLAPEKR